MNRIAILDAYYMFASLYHGGQGSKEYAIFSRLDKLGYKPGRGTRSQDPNRLDDDAREIFDRLVERHEASTFKTMAKKIRLEKLACRTFRPAVTPQPAIAQ